ncbi:TIGR03767 family metallophosphoesterase [Jatrophihabitans sp. DSM 45814]
MTTTDRATVVGASRSAAGYWKLAAGPGEPHVRQAAGPHVRGAFDTGAGTSSPGTSLLTIGHLSDLHICDSQSPARAEFLDRWADDDSPIKHLVDAVGSYRAQDCLTVQVAEAMVRSLNDVSAGPIGGQPLDWAIVTGDVTDNAQENELGWSLRVLEGGPILPDSGDPARYEGVASSHERAYWDEAFWHPEPGVADKPKRVHGFPDAPALLDALRMPFDATGLAVPWLAVHGNHDQMPLGTIPAVGPFADAGNLTLKAIGLPEHWSMDAIAQFCHDMDTAQLDVLTLWESLRFRPVTADLSRRTVSRAEFVAAHFGSAARPPGHGFAGRLEDFDSATDLDERAYYRYDHGQVTVLVMDTVNENGGWQGSLDVAQFVWLDEQLAAADIERRYVVLASHHPLSTLINPRLPNDEDWNDSARRVLGGELDQMLQGHPSLILWLNGHTHRTLVTPHSARARFGRGSPSTWWEVTAPSLIDYPQQARLVEVLRSDSGIITIATTMVDHAGSLPWGGEVDSVLEMAGLSRELAANNWQWRTDDLAQHGRAGTPADRNVLLTVADPFH